MSGVELILAFLSGVVMGREHRDDAPDQWRADVYSSARIGAAAALTLVLVVPDYHVSPAILLPLLGAILALLGLEASAVWRGVR